MHPLTPSTATTRCSLSLSTALALVLSAGTGMAAVKAKDQTPGSQRTKPNAAVRRRAKSRFTRMNSKSAAWIVE
jgi:hypothetical protein